MIAELLTGGVLGIVTVVVVGGALREHRRAYLARRAERPDASWWELSE